MNKKGIIAIVCSALLVIIAIITIVIITNSNKSKEERQDTKVFKEALMALKDSQDINKKGYEIDFIEDFDYEEKDDNENNTTDYNAHYESYGYFMLSYENKSNNKISLEDGFQSFIKNGIGFISGEQSEKHVIKNDEIDKATKTSIRKEDLNYTINNNFIIDSIDNNLQVYSDTKYINNNDNTKNVNDNFSGKINKELLMNTYEISKFNEGIKRLMFIDVWGDVNTLISFIHNSYKNVDLNNNSEINKIIDNTGLTYKINGDIIELSYKLDLDDEFKNVKNNYDCIDFMIDIDTKTKEVKYFKFDLSKYLESILKSDTNGDSNVSAKVNQFYIYGKIINDTLTRKNIENVNYVEYNEETKYDFIDDFVSRAIPGREDHYNV